MYVIGTNKAHDIILIHEVKTKDKGIRYMEHINRAYVRLAGDVVC